MLAGVWVSNAARARVAPASPALPAAASLHTRGPGTEVSRDSRDLVGGLLGSWGGAGRGPSFPPVRGRPWSSGFPVAGRGVHCAASRTPPGWTAQPGSAPPEPALGWEDICLPAWAPVLASHLSSGAFSLEQPRPSPECALPPALPSPGSEPAGLVPGVGGGLPYPKVLAPGTGFPFPAPTLQHSGDGGGGAWLQLPFVPRGMAETRWPCWASPGGRTARGAGFFRETLVLLCAGSPRSASRARWEESRPTGFCLQPEVGPAALQGTRPPELSRNPSTAPWHGFQLLGLEALEEEMTVEHLSVPSALPALKLPRVQA